MRSLARADVLDPLRPVSQFAKYLISIETELGHGPEKTFRVKCGLSYNSGPAPVEEVLWPITHSKSRSNCAIWPNRT